MMCSVVVLLETCEHLFEQLFAVASEHFMRRDVPEVAKLDFVWQNSGVPFNRMKKRYAIRVFGVSKRSVEIKKKTIKVHHVLRKSARRSSKRPILRNFS